MKVVLATKNLAKFNEFEELASGTKLDLIPVKSKEFCLPDETGSSFQENAFLKANFTYRKLQVPVLADDSGLEVDALQGQPGVHSARYGGESLTSDEERVSLLLKNIESVKWAERTARFKCVIAIAETQKAQFEQAEYANQGSSEARPIASVVGSISGMIQYEPQGEDGFGYDPVFYLPSFKQTMAEMTLEYKNLISHRSDATRKVIQVLRSLAIRCNT